MHIIRNAQYLHNISMHKDNISTHIKKPRLHIQYISFKNLINILLYNYSKILLLHYIATTLLLLL